MPDLDHESRFAFQKSFARSTPQTLFCLDASSHWYRLDSILFPHARRVIRAASNSVGQMARQFSSGSKSFQFQADQTLDWKDGDAVFAFVDDRWEWVGSVRNSRTDDGTARRRLRGPIRSCNPDFEKSWEYYETPESMAWVANVMLPEDKVKQLSKELVTRFRSRQHELAMNLEPSSSRPFAI